MKTVGRSKWWGGGRGSTFNWTSWEKIQPACSHRPADWANLWILHMGVGSKASYSKSGNMGKISAQKSLKLGHVAKEGVLWVQIAQGLNQGCCYGLNVCVLPHKFVRRCPYPQCDGWGLWQVTGFRWSHRGGALMMELVTLWGYKGTRGALPLHHVRIQQENSHL